MRLRTSSFSTPGGINITLRVYVSKRKKQNMNKKSEGSDELASES